MNYMSVNKKADKLRVSLHLSHVTVLYASTCVLLMVGCLKSIVLVV